MVTLTAGVALLLAMACYGGPVAAEVFAGVTLIDRPASSATNGGLLLFDDHQLLTTPTLTSAGLLAGLARNPLTGELFSVANGVQLVRVDFERGTLTPTTSLLGLGNGDGIRSLAFDSAGHLYGLVLCGATYTNELLQIDPVTGAVTGVLGALDSGRVGSCATQSLTLGGVIAIDPSDDTLYFASNDNTGALFIDSLNNALVPTLIYSPGPVLGVVVPTAATFSGGVLRLAFAASLEGPGLFFASLDPKQPSSGLTGSGGPGYDAFGFHGSALLYGMAPVSVPCEPSSTSPCLYNRFKVQVTYDALPSNGAGPATALLESSASVKFSFFDPSNVELIVKILNACTPPFHRWWVAGGGLTNVGVQIKVTDTKTSQVKTYSSRKGTLFQPFFDTSAFACP